jgi:hypothetical protein
MSTMDELIKQITERTGISEEQARGAVELVVEFLKQRLPEPAAGYLDTAITSPKADGAVGGIMDRLGGLFGGK